MKNTPKHRPLRLNGVRPLLDADALALTGVNPRTLRRWKSGEARTPPAAQGLLELHASGAVLPDRWQGYYFDASGQLCTPYGQRYAPDDLQAVFWYMQELRTLRGELRRLTREFDLTPKDQAQAIDEKKSGELPPP